jgi:hypothetical protein
MSCAVLASARYVRRRGLWWNAGETRNV